MTASAIFWNVDFSSGLGAWASAWRAAPCGDLLEAGRLGDDGLRGEHLARVALDLADSWPRPAFLTAAAFDTTAFLRGGGLGFHRRFHRRPSPCRRVSRRLGLALRLGGSTFAATFLRPVALANGDFVASTLPATLFTADFLAGAALLFAAGFLGAGFLAGGRSGLRAFLDGFGGSFLGGHGGDGACGVVVRCGGGLR